MLLIIRVKLILKTLCDVYGHKFRLCRHVIYIYVLSPVNLWHPHMRGWTGGTVGLYPLPRPCIPPLFLERCALSSQNFPLFPIFLPSPTPILPPPFLPLTSPSRPLISHLPLSLPASHHEHGLLGRSVNRRPKRINVLSLPREA